MSQSGDMTCLRKLLTLPRAREYGFVCVKMRFRNTTKTTCKKYHRMMRKKSGNEEK